MPRRGRLFSFLISLLGDFEGIEKNRRLGSMTMCCFGRMSSQQGAFQCVFNWNWIRWLLTQKGLKVHREIYGLIRAPSCKKAWSTKAVQNVGTRRKANFFGLCCSFGLAKSIVCFKHEFFMNGYGKSLHFSIADLLGEPEKLTFVLVGMKVWVLFMGEFNPEKRHGQRVNYKALPQRIRSANPWLTLSWSNGGNSHLTSGIPRSFVRSRFLGFSCTACEIDSWLTGQRFQ